MGNLKKWVLVLVVGVISCSVVLGFDPKEFKPNVEFTVISPEKSIAYWYRNSNRRAGRGPIHPTHQVYVQVYGRYEPVDFSGSKGVERLLQTPSGRGTSPEQQEFMAKCDSMYSNRSGGNSATLSTMIYAVTIEDARKMAMALVEALTEQAAEARAQLETERDATRDRIEQVEASLPGQETAMNQAREKFDTAKRQARYMFLSDSEAREKAKDTVIRITDELDSLEVSIVGIRERLQAVRDIRSGRTLSEASLQRLAEMEIEDEVELRSIMAQQEAASKIIEQARSFHDTYEIWSELRTRLNQAQSDLRSLKKGLAGLESSLADRERLELMPPELRGEVAICTVKEH